MDQHKWARLAAVADTDPAFARRLLQEPMSAAHEAGVDLSADDASILSAFASGIPDPEGIAAIRGADIELMLAVNH